MGLFLMYSDVEDPISQWYQLLKSVLSQISVSVKMAETVGLWIIMPLNFDLHFHGSRPTKRPVSTRALLIPLPAWVLELMANKN